jgi:hypothetical protein
MDLARGLADRTGVRQSTKVVSAGATRTVVAAFGAVVAMAGLEHGIGEVLQGPVAPDAPGLLRPRLPARAAGPRDPGHLPDPRQTDYARRDPRLDKVGALRAAAGLAGIGIVVAALTLGGSRSALRPPGA